MGRLTSFGSLLGLAALLVLASGPASAKDAPKPDPKADPKAKAEAYAGPRLRWAHSYTEALAEARDRGCVLFATFHEDG